jgi:16S rRNA U516 pseudouridylate synthase RsuA-like enzyme
LLQIGSKSLIYLSFLEKQSFIAKNLCEKKNVKKNTCNGKCHLKKQMKKDDAAQNEKSDSKKDKSETTYSTHSILSYIALNKQNNSITFQEEKSFSLHQHHSKILRPPTS